MFAREGTYRDLVTSPVHVTLTDGTLVKGHIERPRSKTLSEFLNEKELFVEIEHFDGSKALYNKSAIQSLGPKEIPSSEQLKLATLRTDLYSPMAVLGLDASANREMVREAYMKLAKLYHPDRFHSLDMPLEIEEYIENMARRINLAYEEALEMIEPKPKVAARAR